jgi:hypothetical protein
MAWISIGGAQPPDGLWDWQFDPASGDVRFAKWGNGAWETQATFSAGGLVGAQGPQGPVGPQGIPGIQGGGDAGTLNTLTAAQIEAAASAVAQSACQPSPQAWHTVGAQGEPGFAYGRGWQGGLRFRKEGDMVRLAGSISRASSYDAPVIFTLPGGMRPTAIVTFGTVMVYIDGSVALTPICDDDAACFDGITFPTT